MRVHHYRRPKGLNLGFAAVALLFCGSVFAANYGTTPFYPGQKPILTGYYPNPAVNPQTATTTAVADLVVSNQAKNGFTASDPRVQTTLKNSGLALVGGIAGTVVSNAPTGAGVAASLAIGGVCLGGTLGLGSVGCGMLAWAGGAAVAAGVSSLLHWTMNSDGTVTASSGGGADPALPAGSCYSYPNSTICVGTKDAVASAMCSQPGSVCSGTTQGGTGWTAHYTYEAGYIWQEVIYSNGYTEGKYKIGTPTVISGTPAPSGTTYATQQAAVQALSDANKALALNAQTLAALANASLQAAQNVPGSLPANTANPVTEADAQAVIDSMGSNAPTVGDLFSPIGADAVANAGATFTPSSTLGAAATSGALTGSSTVTGAGTGGVTQGSTAGNTTVNVNLGPDPGIGSPSLEATPTASMILAPILALMPDLKAFTVPAHSGTCPTASFSVWGKSWSIDTHCPLIESNRTLIEAAMLLMWSIVIVFITLRA